MKNASALMKRTAIMLTLAASTVPITQAIADESSSHSDNKPLITVYKSATCGCCKKWVSYLEHAGFKVDAINHDNVDAIKVENGLNDPSLRSCHTALVDGYVIEGHVPVRDIERLLSEKPAGVGLTAPGMPMMSPGMSSLIPKDYNVLLFQKNGESSVYSSY